MDRGAMHLNPKYARVEEEEPWKFHPYEKSNNVIEKSEINEKPSTPISKATDSSWLFTLFVLSMVLTLQTILAVGSYSGEFCFRFD
ncbi:hypothetical protein ANCDUO_02600 [Ancylostoma duodenale]|uniref:Uncharacterized protein n=1 Tax=Ancylostoma duodenale TaxID=51022 RepID=A0A0C2HC40_9BILA|nr:hypothetical protein ANCDUO_02600 [Ancylostoma duodenale]